MKLENRRHIASWLLLTVFLSMVCISSFHVHKDVAASTMTECADCMQHNCHGHLTQTALWSHDCVLCQFLTLSFVSIGAVALIIINKVVSLRTDARQRSISNAFSGIVGLRAPPAFSL